MDTTPQKDQRDAAEQRRAKLFGRIIVVGMGLLVLAYIVPLVLDRG